MTMLTRFKRFVAESRRVLRITKKPSWPEFSMLAKVTGTGILVIGFVGFLLTVGKQIVSLTL